MPDGYTGPLDPALLQALEWRLVGPYRGGRVVAVAGDPRDVGTFYFGSTGGGVWKTTDGGMIWENISDGYFRRASVGAIAVSEADPNVIYVGMGEATIRGNVSHGDGVYRSTDAGRTWQHLGLAATRNIGKVRIHPHDPDTVYVAALGHAHGPNPERGVFRSRDGGRTWEHVLFRSENAGAIDLSIDPTNPRIIYAAFWEAIRRPHELVSGGPGSGLFRSTDGGDTWEEITRNPGLPQGLLGKIGVVASPAKPGRVWAIIEAEDGAVFRSDDYGDTWERLSEDRNLRQRPWYYMHIYADPKDPDTVWVLNLAAWKSIDGGKTFFQVAVPHGDNHDLWIDPNNPQRMINGNDGGACVTFNGGMTWSTLYNQPTAELYHVTVDTQVPYRIYAAQQDNTTISLPSRSVTAGITRADYEEVGGGESGYIAVRPDNPNIVFAGSYGGFLTRYDRRTGQRRNIAVWPEASLGWGAKDLKYRFQWTYPIVISPHDPNVLYVTSNVVHRSTDEGESWEVISPDLTRDDKSKQEPSGGPITKDVTGAEYYNTIFAFAESPLQPGLLWAGSDDGLIHVSRDGGQTWQNVTPPDLPEWALISIIEPSPHDPAVAYVAATRYKLDDFTPYLYKTTDYGQTWTRITGGIPEDDFTRVIREDPNRRGLLYCGTETGIYVSIDDGVHWQPFRQNLPVVPIHDLVITGTSLVVATHGRSIWVLDDVSPLYHLPATLDEPAALVPPQTTTRFWTNRGFGHREAVGNNYWMTGATMVTFRPEETPEGTKTERLLDAGQNPPDGVIVYYALKEQPEGEVTLTFLDAEGNEIRTFSSKEPEPAGEAQDEAPKEPRVPAKAGLNRFVWDMRYPAPTRVEGYATPEAKVPGPLAKPGRYQVRLTVGDRTWTESFEIVKDPRVSATQEDFDAQFALLLQIRDKLSQTHEAVNRIRAIKRQVEDWGKRTEGLPIHEEVERSGKTVADRLTAIEEDLIQVKAKVREDALNYPLKLNAKLGALMGVVASADARPTRQAVELFAELSRQVDDCLGRLDEVVKTDVAAFNGVLRDAGIPPVVA
nr:MAG: glycosyl hydrolase [Sphaerobacter thermophilus]